VSEKNEKKSVEIEKKMKKSIDKSGVKWYYINIYRYFCAYLPQLRPRARAQRQNKT
jgi:hypothetical protein